jgi:hypothetical protein
MAFLHAVIFNPLIQIKVNSRIIAIFCKFIIAVRVDHCNYFPLATKNVAMPLVVLNL